MGIRAIHSLSAVAIRQRIDQYAEEFGLEAEHDPYRDTFYLPAGHDTGLRVVSMPKTVGVVIRNRLLDFDIRAPIISHESITDRCDHDRRWHFLAAASPEDAELQRELTHNAVLLVHKISTFLGLRITLPMPGDSRHVWIELPVKNEIPLFLDLVDGIRHVLTPMGSS